MSSEEPRWDPRLDRDPHSGHSFLRSPNGGRTYLVELKTDSPVRVEARLEGWTKTFWSAISPRRRNTDRDERWQRGLAKCRAELEADRERDRNLGLNGSRPSDYATAAMLFYVDCREYPGDWPADYKLSDGSPNEKLERSASDRILKAIKRL